MLLYMLIWQLKVSYKKCTSVLVHRANHDPVTALKLITCKILVTSHVRDVGVFIDNRLMFNSQISESDSFKSIY